MSHLITQTNNEMSCRCFICCPSPVTGGGRALFWGVTALRVRASLRLSCPYEFVTKMVWFTLHKTKKYFQTVLLPHYYIFYLERSKVNSKVKVNDAKIVKTPISFSVRNSTADIPICFEQRPKRCTILGGPFIAPLHFGQGQCQRSRIRTQNAEIDFGRNSAACGPIHLR